MDLLRDGSAETYWQSDGTQPHLVNVQFQRKVQLREVALHLSYKNDESYTPQRLSVRVGNGFHDLREVKAVEPPSQGQRSDPAVCVTAVRLIPGLAP